MARSRSGTSWRDSRSRMRSHPTVGSALHREVLEALSTSAHGPVDPARLSHHADAAGDVEAVLRYAPEAGERAAGLCVHREAAEQFAPRAQARRGADAGAPGRAVGAAVVRVLSVTSSSTPPWRRARRRWRFIRSVAIGSARGTTAGGCRVWPGSPRDRATAVREARRAVELLGSRAARPRARDGLQQRVAAGDACRRRGRGDRVRRACDRSRRAARGDRDPRARAEQRRRRRGARAAAGWQWRSSSAASRSRSSAGYEEHVARAYTNLGAGDVWAAQLRERRPQPHHRDRLLRGARSRSLAAST